MDRIIFPALIITLLMAMVGPLTVDYTGALTQNLAERVADDINGR